MADALEINVDVDEIWRFAEAMKAAPHIAAQESDIAMRSSLALLEGQIKPRTPVNTGRLRASISQEKYVLGTNFRGVVLTPLVYGLPVEYGRDPGRPPPVSAIRYWIIRKGYAQGKEADRFAYALARAIGKRGTEGAKMFQEGFDAARPYIIKVWEGVPGKVLARLARE